METKPPWISLNSSLLRLQCNSFTVTVPTNSEIKIHIFVCSMRAAIASRSNIPVMKHWKDCSSDENTCSASLNTKPRGKHDLKLSRDCIAVGPTTSVSNDAANSIFPDEVTLHNALTRAIAEYEIPAYTKPTGVCTSLFKQNNLKLLTKLNTWDLKMTTYLFGTKQATYLFLQAQE